MRLKRTNVSFCSKFHRDADNGDPTWVGCARTNMYPIVGALTRLPNNTRLSKLYISECAVPQVHLFSTLNLPLSFALQVPAELLKTVRPVQLQLEASNVRELGKCVHEWRL